MRPRSCGAACADKDTEAVRNIKTQRPQRMRRTEFKSTVLRHPCGPRTVRSVATSMTFVPLTLQSSVSFVPLCDLVCLPRVPEHHLRQPHEPALRDDRAEGRVALDSAHLVAPELDTV